MDYEKTVTLDVDYEEAVRRVKEAFAGQGFGTLTEIDVRDTLKKKLGEDMERYVILGVCNPQLAHAALGVSRKVGTLLPCTVVVREHDAGAIVHALDPGLIATIPGLPELAPIASEASGRIDAALRALEGSTPAADRPSASAR